MRGTLRAPVEDGPGKMEGAKGQRALAQAGAHSGARSADWVLLRASEACFWPQTVSFTAETLLDPGRGRGAALTGAVMPHDPIGRPGYETTFEVRPGPRPPPGYRLR